MNQRSKTAQFLKTAAYVWNHIQEPQLISKFVSSLEKTAEAPLIMTRPNYVSSFIGGIDR